MTDPDQEPLRRLATAADRVCRLADHPDVQDEYNRSDEYAAFRAALAELAAVLRTVDPVPLPSSRRAPTVADVVATVLDLPGLSGLEEVADRLTDAQVERALVAALALPDRDRQADLLVAVAARLDAKQAERALAAVPHLDRASQQARTVTALLPRLPTGRRPRAAAFALVAARRAHPSLILPTVGDLAPWLDATGRTELYGIAAEHGPEWHLHLLAAHQLPAQRAAVLATALGDEHEPSRARSLAALAPHLDDDQLATAVAAARDIGDPTWRATALTGLATALSGERRRGAVDGALDAGAQGGRLDWPGLLPLLTPDQTDAALAAVAASPYPDGVATALGGLLPLLPPARLPAAVAAAHAIRDGRIRAVALAELVPALPAELRATALAAAIDALLADPVYGWFAPLGAVGPHATPAQLARLWAAALAEEDDYPQGALAALAPYVDAERREQALRLALGYEPAHRAEALGGLVPHLDEAQRRRAYRAVSEIGDPSTRAVGLAGLVAYLSPADAAEATEAALTTAAGLRDPAARTRLLTDLARRLDGPARDTALAWAFAAARTIGAEQRGPRFPALTDLVPLLADR
ncbi:hypothetical protein [Micromonospora sp. IBSANI012]|uniref:hypothetical protein n=1 Tax=Micromonospora sp. IBSANI012 TaxID=3457761 RepID=UPI004059FEB7